jgi:hypothetical protein
MPSSQRTSRKTYAMLALALSATGSMSTRMATMTGEAKPGAIAGVAALGVAAVAGMKLLAKSGVSGAAKFAASKGAIGVATKVGIGSAGTREGLIVLSAHEARDVLSATTRGTLHAGSDLLSPQYLPDLFRKYPELAALRSNSAKYEAFVSQNPRFLEDASLSLYRKNPSLFAERFAEQRVLGLYQDQFGGVVHQQVKSQNQESIQELLASVSKSLEKKGYSSAALQGMEEKALEKLVEKALNQEIERTLKKSDYKWTYKSGTLGVKGEVGHFAFEQEVSLTTLAKATAAGAAVTAGYKVVWNKDSFVQVKSCIGDFCLNVDSNKRQLAVGAESANSTQLTTAK